ncbi:MAG: hypothetical protein KAH20_09495 [Methylococcales bacterium]|nr:hypothetical protein [Methylococcales bacterium]
MKCLSQSDALVHYNADVKKSASLTAEKQDNPSEITLLLAQNYTVFLDMI